MDEGEEARVRRTAEAGEAGSGRVILNTRELTEQIHLPTPPFFFYPSCLFFASKPPICISPLGSFLLLSSVPTPFRLRLP